MKVRLSSFRGCRHVGTLSGRTRTGACIWYGAVVYVPLYAAVSHFLDELLVVLFEEFQQSDLAFHAQSGRHPSAWRQ